jgi:2-polyprenyl-6-methoxyphenol hydroxylase-like FAD-dependent oxidoreductase
VATDEDGAEVTLEDGTVLRGDLVLGADGVHSVVRRAIDPAAPPARYVGLANFGGITRQTPLAERLPAESWQFVFGRRAFFGAHPTPDGDVVWFVNVPREEVGREERTATSPAQWQAELASLVADDAGAAHELITTGELELGGDSTYDLPHLPTWSRGRLALVGDALHAPSPSSGQGASLALEDAVVMAAALRDARDPAAAFASFEFERRSRVERVVAAGARSSRAKIPGRAGRLVQEAVLRLVFRYAVTDRSQAWVTSHRVDLGAPTGRG